MTRCSFVRYDVRAFGAKGDGETDDTDAIQKAFDAVSDNLVTGDTRPATGGTVYFPSGTYYVTRSIKCEKHSLVVEGDGGGGYRWGSQTNVVTDQAIIVFDFGNSTLNFRGVQVRNISVLDRTDRKQAPGALGAFMIRNMNHVRFENVTVSDFENGYCFCLYSTPDVVDGIIIKNKGTGYTSAPTVTISGGGGTGATATANIAQGVTAITVSNGGTGYTSAPTVTISGGGGMGATVEAVISAGVVTKITVKNPGSSYTSAPTVTISGGGGTGATATTTVSGVVDSITITNKGSGYTNAPAVSITGGGGTGATARADAPNQWSILAKFSEVQCRNNKFGVRSTGRVSAVSLDHASFFVGLEKISEKEADNKSIETRKKSIEESIGIEACDSYVISCDVEGYGIGVKLKGGEYRCGYNRVIGARFEGNMKHVCIEKYIEKEEHHIIIDSIIIGNTFGRLMDLTEIGFEKSIPLQRHSPDWEREYQNETPIQIVEVEDKPGAISEAARKINYDTIIALNGYGYIGGEIDFNGNVMQQNHIMGNTTNSYIFEPQLEMENRQVHFRKESAIQPAETAMLLRVNRFGALTLDPVTIGEVDSGGPGHRVLRVPN